MKQKYFIDTFKFFTFIVILGLMAYYKQWNNTTAWVYLAMHGTYGLLWVMKGRIFPDKNWEKPAPLWYNLGLSLGLSLYWVAPYFITSESIEAPAWLLGIAVSLFTFGIFFHYTADMQKFIQLKYNPGQLITDGFMGLSRNINFFGEFLIYLAFIILPMKWWWLLIYLVGATLIWGAYIAQKEKSLSRYPEFAEYKKKVKLFFPYLY
jgi:steroid 5-alpha reductase family enzyme